MKYLTDKKSWTVAIVESLGVLLFNVVFVSSIYSILGDEISTEHVAIVSAILFVLRVFWFYLNIKFRLFLEKDWP